MATTEIPKTYSPANVESKWYAFWEQNKYFKSTPDSNKTPYTIVMPPPNVTGTLHMGHMLNNTIQDILVRKKRMEGYEACWVPGTDHASIATETKVVNMLREKGIDKNSLSREEFLEYAWEWKEKYGGIILEQLKKLGASCDWDRTRFTMEEDLSAAVIEVFVRLYNKGRIYRGNRMVNWDPVGKTALSDEEVNYKEVNSKLYHIRYKLKGDSGDEWVTIATTRPETLLGDTAVCVNPQDPRYTHLEGKKAVVPVVEREVPVIFDEYVDMEYGSGCLKVTPAHDENDYNLGVKHNLPFVDIFNEDGTVAESVGHYAGMDRFDVREKLVADLEQSGLLVDTEDIVNNVGYSERTDVPIEPKLSVQWFCRMDELSKPALEHVMNDNIRFFPPKFKNMYRSWMENIRDWCISRQLWWGQRIPAYYFTAENGETDFVVAKTPEEALKLAQEKSGKKLNQDDLKQDEDVLDTWFSSWLWPISVFDGFKEPENPDINYYYPTDDLVTAPEILFFWVARMIISGYEFMGDKPFKNVYLTGIVRDKHRQKMSKSLGNSPDPLRLIDDYGADGVRVGMLFSSPAGNDLLFDEKLCEQGRNFCNKLWNAFRLVKNWQVDDQKVFEQELPVRWFKARFTQELKQLEDHFDKFRISDALMSVYKLIWDNFCSWYLEMVKPAYGDSVDAQTYQETIVFFEDLMKVLHPFMPFITEELWHLLLEERPQEDCIIVAEWPEAKEADQELLDRTEFVKDLITQVRHIRTQNNIPNKETVDLYVKTGNSALYQQFEAVIHKLAGTASLQFTEEEVPDAVNVVVGQDELFIPVSTEIDKEAEKQRLQEELEYNQGFLKSVDKKLSNEKFVNNAPPEVVEREKQKKADAEAKIKTLEDMLNRL